MSRWPFHLALASLSLSAPLYSGPARAAGVPAGTVIENTATATYNTGSGTATLQSNTVSLRVDELIDVAVASLTGAPVPLATGSAVLSYAVSNKGNGPEAFRLSVDPALAGNPFVGTVQTLAYDSNANGTYDAGIDTVVAAGGSTPMLGADASLRVFVVVALPAGATDAATSQVRLSAAAETGTGTPGTTFAGRGDGGVDAVVGATTAQASALAAIVARLGSVELSKAASITDPFGGSRPVPGALVTYRLVTHVSGSGSAEGVSVSDAIPAGTTYQPGTLRLDGTPLSDAADTDSGTAGPGGIAVALGTLAAGSPDRTIAFTVKIN